MDPQVARSLAQVVQAYRAQERLYHVEALPLRQGELAKFHQWADSRPCEGAFLVRAPHEVALWVVIVDWKRTANFYLVLFPESRTGPLAELHECEIDGGDHTLHWKYSPTKRDGKNPKRRAYFQEVFKSEDAFISVPTDIWQVDDFFDELFSLAAGRQKADDLDDDRPPTRDGFPEGKLKERLHLSRERNPEIIRQAKRLALQRDGCLRCTCCGFDFEAVYGHVGIGFVEAHHTKPLSTLHRDGDLTRIEDIALVCSNCHRMLHRRRPWLEIHELTHLLSDG